MRWIRFRDSAGRALHAHVDDARAQPVEGSPFGDWRDRGDSVALDSIDWLPPVQPSKVIALWKNFHALVVGQTMRAVAPAGVRPHLLGCTIANDVTAMELIGRDPSFAQWSRAKSFDTFGVLGPWIDTEFDWSGASVRTRVNGRERQHYPLADMIFGPIELLSRLSHDMTLEPGDVVLCGTSVGSLPMRPGSEIEVEIDGLGVLANRYG